MHSLVKQCGLHMRRSALKLGTISSIGSGDSSSTSSSSMSHSSSILVLINPNSGRGEAGALESQVRSALQHADVDYEVVVTNGPGHAKAAVLNSQTRWRTILCLSGDGTVHEVINGVYAKGEDWKYLLQVSANGLIYHFQYQYIDTFSDVNTRGDAHGIWQCTGTHHPAPTGMIY